MPWWSGRPNLRDAVGLHHHRALNSHGYSRLGTWVECNPFDAAYLDASHEHGVAGFELLQIAKPRMQVIALLAATHAKENEHPGKKCGKTCFHSLVGSAEVIIQVWISTHFGVLSEQPLIADERFLFINAILIPPTRGRKASF
jgi:hypothetical protein